MSRAVVTRCILVALMSTRVLLSAARCSSERNDARGGAGELASARQAGAGAPSGHQDAAR